ncbi:MAG: hypothetical protein HY074_03360 [Deltaproteobacteria bacterium]|nr:hypothetical protein [Deltaproteobacteria bacterium]
MIHRSAQGSARKVIKIIFAGTLLCLWALAAPGAFAADEPEPLALPDRSPAQAGQAYDSPTALQQAYRDGQKLSADGNHYESAAVFFNIYTAQANYQDVALGHVAEELILAGYPNAASYFYIQTLQRASRPAIRRILAHLPAMLEAVGGDLLRPYIVRNTTEADYDGTTRTHFYYFLGKDELLKGEPAKALQALSHVSSGAGILAQAAYLRAAAYAMTGQTSNAISSFENCRNLAGKSESRTKSLKQEYFDLEARCTAGLARAYYQAGQFDKAEETYDDIPKASFVWTDILFEQGWNAFAKGDYNRTLGKLVSYRSPSLSFVFNPEVDVLRAQSFFALCDYEDVDKAVHEFESRYAGVGSQMKSFLLSHDRDLGSFYGIAKEALKRKLHTNDLLSQALNRFIRGPYFAAQITQERAVYSEAARSHSLAAAANNRKFANFLSQVINWRAKTVRVLGGLFVKNSLLDIYNDLVTDLDKMAYIKLEMLGRTKLRLEKKQVVSADEDGVLKKGSSDVGRKDYQYFWTFNGEFWVDELGDYVFALESQCGT